MEVRFHRLAVREFREARAWYEARRTGLGGEFLAELDRAVERITTHPDRWPLFRERFRKVRLRRFLLSVLVALSTIGSGISRVSAQDKEAQPGTFRGRVVDESGKPVPGARVWLYRQTGRWEHSDTLIRKITTAPDGAFSFRKPPDLRPSGTTSPNRGYVLRTYAFENQGRFRLTPSASLRERSKTRTAGRSRELRSSSMPASCGTSNVCGPMPRAGSDSTV
jgi:hypothetical protein